LIPDSSTDSLRVRIPEGLRIPARWADWFDAEGRLVGDPLETLSILRTAADSRWPDLRISQEVEDWLEARNRAAERLQLRREYELKVQSGEWPAHETRVPLFPYQREGMLHLAFTGRALLADEMGLGKTIQAIAACALLRRLNRARRVLIVTPASLKAEWEEQIRRFTDLPVRLVYGSSHQRRKTLREDDLHPEEAPFFTVMNYEQIIPDVEEINTRFHPDVVILDEAQRIKNWNTKTARRVKLLRSRFAFVLTGTPIENRIDELRSLVDFLDPTLLGPLFRFNREYYALNERGRPEACKNLDRLHARVRPILLRRRKQEVETQLPPRTDHQRFVPLTDRQRRTYASHEQEVMRLATAMERRPLTEREQERLQIELAMMRMICDSNYILDPEDRECPKLAELEQILSDCLANDAKAIVFSEWERMLELVRCRCEERGIEYAWHTGSVPQQRRRSEIQRFKEDPECRVFLSTDAGATGLNLQTASVVVNCDLPWNPARLEQRIARAWRKNQARPVTVYSLIAQDTLEHRMLETLATKRKLALRVLDEPGDGSPIPLRSGRREMMERIRDLMRPAGEGPATQPGQERPQAALPPQDPVLDIIGKVRRRLGASLMACEERRIPDRPDPVLVFVVDNNADRRRAEIEKCFAEATPDPGSGSINLPRIEVIDRVMHEAIRRLTDAGLLRSSQQEVRDLLPAADALSPPPLTPEQQAAREAHKACARRQIQLARVLMAGGFPEETRRPLLLALEAWVKAVAIEARQPEPATTSEFLDSPAWVETHLDQDDAHRFLSDEHAPGESFLKAMETALGGVEEN
jgi:superfamily II DNA or RNA helicase